jgi:hypothetical protein
VSPEPDQPSLPSAEQTRDDVNRVAAFLARRDFEAPSTNGLPRFDVLVLCGSAVLAAVELAAAVFRDGLAGQLLVSGGVGHSTPHLRKAVGEHARYGDVLTSASPESGIIADILHRHLGIPEAAILTEDRSTNCGENAEFSVRRLGETSLALRSVLLLQDPTLQRRTHECFLRWFRGSGVRVWSYAPFVPTVHDLAARAVQDDDGRMVWSMRRFTSLVLGEMRRLTDDEQGYGPQGADYIDHVDIPSDVMGAHKRLKMALPDLLGRDLLPTSFTHTPWR